MSKLRIAVHGATGTQGAPVVRRLAARGHEPVAVVRDPAAPRVPAGAERRVASLLDVDALARAYEGADGVFLHLPLVFDEALGRAMGDAAVAAAERAGVGHVVFLTGGPLPPGPIGVPGVDLKVHAAKAVLGRRFAATLLEPPPYMENLAAPWSLPLVARGELRYPLPAEAPLPWIALDDVAAYAVAALERGEAAAGRFAIAGPEPLTGDEVAREVAAAAGRPVRWVPVSPDAYGHMLVPYAGEATGRGVASLYRAAAEAPAPAAAAAGPDPGLARRELPVELTPLRAWARGVRWGAEVARAA